MKKVKFDLKKLNQQIQRDKSCFICDIRSLKKDEDILYEDNLIIAFFDRYPASKGHVLVALKKHYERINEIPFKTFLEFQKIAYKFYKAIRKAFNPKKIIVFYSGGIVSHFHFHLMPEYKNTDFKEMILRTHIFKFSKKEKEKIKKLIKENL